MRSPAHVITSVVMENSVGAVVVIQYNWEENLRKNERVWIYHKNLNEKSKVGNIDDASFKVVSKNNRAISIRFVPKELTTMFVCPMTSFEGIHSKSITCLDVGNGGLGISVSADNKLLVWETRDGLVRRNLEGHLFDVYSCRLFPSGVVVLSAGADMQIKIWDAATGLCPSTLRGHTAAVTDTSIIKKGRNIISVSKDGKAKLWNCAESKCLTELLVVESEINCCEVIDGGNEIEFPESNVMSDVLEFDTKGILLALGCEDGKVFLISVHGREIMNTHFLSVPILCLCWLSSFQLVMGLEDGRIMLLDAKNLQQVPQLLCHDSASGVLCVKPLKNGVIVGRKDGLCQFYLLDGSCSVQLTGPDCDPIYSVASDDQFVYTACRDALIRKYRIRDMGL